MTEPMTYEFRVRGVVSGRTASTFEELDMRCDTLMSGVVEDQSALHGLLDRIRDLGLELIEVRRVPDDPLESNRPLDVADHRDPPP